MSRTVRVRAGGGYDVKIGGGLLRECGAELAALLSPRMAFVVTDSGVAPLCLEDCLTSLTGAGFRCASFTFPAGEESKTLSTLSDLLEAMAGEGVSRSDCVLALGGGVTGDMAGFAAGCYMRGVRFVQLPTTLLAAVDSSVGGKTAVDLSAGKNLAGVFHQPSLVLCDTDRLATLPERELLCGAAEALKTGILMGGELFRLFEEGAALEHLPEVIALCVEYKAGVVERDEREQGERKLLNLGHTVGHAIERCSDFSLPHGLAVAEGMAVIARASARRGWCAPETARRIEAALRRSGLPTATNFTPDELAAAALSDKKRSGGVITLAIPAAIGACDLRTTEVSELAGIIADGVEEAS